MKKFLILVLILFLAGCDTLGLNGDGGSHKGDGTDPVPIVTINTDLTTVMEDGAVAEDWTAYFIVEDEFDPNAKMPEKGLRWDPEFDPDVPGEYKLMGWYTNEKDYSAFAEVIITVKEYDKPTEGMALFVEIEPTTGLTEIFLQGAEEANWEWYFTILVDDVQVDTPLDAISFDPELDMNTPGEYTMKLDYVAADGATYSSERTITIIENDIPDIELKDLTPTSIFDMIMYGYAWEEYRVDNLEVVLIAQDGVIASVDGEFILIRTQHEDVAPIAATLQVGDIINVVGELHTSSGNSIALGFYTSQLEIVSTGIPTEYVPLESVLEEASGYDMVSLLSALRTDIGVYTAANRQINGAEVVNETGMQDGVSYRINYVVTSSYEGYAPEIYVISYEEAEDSGSGDDTTEQVFYYTPRWDLFHDGSEVRTSVSFVAALSEYQFVAQLNNNNEYYAFTMIIDTEGTPFEWISQSLIEGGILNFDTVTKYTSDDSGVESRIVPNAEPRSVAASMPAYFSPSAYNKPYELTAEELYEELRHTNEDLGILDEHYLENGFIMTAEFDADTNTFGGFNVSNLGVQPKDSGTYTVSFVFTKLLKEAPFGEIAILPYYYSLPTFESLNNEFVTFRNLIVTSNDGDTVQATNTDSSVLVRIDVTDNPTWDSIEVDDIIHVIGVAHSDGSMDIEIEVDAIEITITN